MLYIIQIRIFVRDIRVEYGTAYFLEFRYQEHKTAKNSAKSLFPGKVVEDEEKI